MNTGYNPPNHQNRPSIRWAFLFHTRGFIMNKRDFEAFSSAIAAEKHIETDDVVTILFDGIAHALRKDTDIPENTIIHVDFDDDTGQMVAWSEWEITNDVVDEAKQITPQDAQDNLKEGHSIEGNTLYVNLPVTLGRTQHNQVKQYVMQRLNKESRAARVQDILERPQQIIFGVVRNVRPDKIMVEYDNMDFFIPKGHFIPRNTYKVGSKIPFIIEQSGTHYFGSQTSDRYFLEEIKQEISAIKDGTIEVVAMARHPGVRTKLILRSTNKTIDPILEFIGYRGANIKNLKATFGEEMIEAVKWSPDLAQQIVYAFDPIEITNIEIDETNNAVTVAVMDLHMPRAVGRNGSNIETISKMIGKKINLISSSDWDKSSKSNNAPTVATFMRGLSCDEDLANILISDGFTSLEDVAYIPIHEWDCGLDDDTIQSLRDNAKSTIDAPDEYRAAVGIGELISQGISPEDADILQANQVINGTDLADLATDELMEILTEYSEEQASSVIMKSRAKFYPE